MEEEMLKHVDDNNTIVGSVGMKEAHEKGILHRSVHVWIITSDNRIILQKRSHKMRRFPGLYDISAAGHVKFGEEEVISAKREIEEELGLVLDLKRESAIIRDYLETPEGLIENEFQYLYFAISNTKSEEIRLQEEEVDSIKLVSFEEFKEELESSPEKFVPHSQEYFKVVFDHLQSLIEK